VLDLAFEELHVGGARLARILPGQRQHLVGHVEPVGLAGGRHPPRRQEHIDAAARAQVEHDLSGAQLRQRGGIAATQRGPEGLVRQASRLLAGIEVTGDRIAPLGR
jgi:hypothetical protein